MEFDVFLSYSSKDKVVADAACHALESAGLRCWIAPRDITPGSEWGASIVKAIAGAKAMVLIFSNDANQSRQVTREVERAVNKGIPIVPVRIADIIPTESLEYFLSTPHWLDAFPPPFTQHFQNLTQADSALIGRPAQASTNKAPVARLSTEPATPASPATRGAPAALEKKSTLVTGPDLQSLSHDPRVLAKLNEQLKLRGYDWLAITAETCVFGHYCVARWTGPTYDMSINYEIRRGEDGLQVEILDCTRLD